MCQVRQHTIIWLLWTETKNKGNPLIKTVKNRYKEVKLTMRFKTFEKQNEVQHETGGMMVIDARQKNNN